MATMTLVFGFPAIAVLMYLTFYVNVLVLGLIRLVRQLLCALLEMWIVSVLHFNQSNSGFKNVGKKCWPIISGCTYTGSVFHRCFK